MKIEREPVQTFIEYWRCECATCDGNMIPTDKVFTVYPPVYEHICDKCGHRDHARCTYPRIVHEKKAP